VAKFYNNACNVVGAPTPEGDLRKLPGCSLRAILVLHKCNSMLEQPYWEYVAQTRKETVSEASADS